MENGKTDVIATQDIWGITKLWWWITKISKNQMIKSFPYCLSATDGWKTRPLLKKLGKSKPNIVEIINYSEWLPKRKEPRYGKVCNNSSYGDLATSIDDPLIPVKIIIYEVVSRKLKELLILFQTD